MVCGMSNSLGGKHAASRTGYHGLPPEALIEQYREMQAKRKPTPEERAALLAAFDDPVPVMDHPFIKLVQSFLPCTLVKELDPKTQF